MKFSVRSFLYTLRWYYVAMLGIFFLCAGIAFYAPSAFSFFDTYLERLFAEARTLEGFELFWFIFANNVRAAFLGMIGGVVFGLLPLSIGIMNGLVLGYVGALVTAREGFGALWRLLPHGIFELPALFLALALGLRLGVASLATLSALVTGKREHFMPVFRASLLTFFFVVLPLLLLAALIEAWFIGLGV